MTHESQPYNLQGRRAAVTGGTSGIGRAIALALAKQGAHVWIHGRSEQRADRVAAEVRQLGASCDVVLGDLEDGAFVKRLCHEATDWKPDIWVNNAGADVLTGEAAQWTFERKLETLWKVDVLACIQLSRSIGQTMRADLDAVDRVIVNIGWDQAELGMEGDSGEMFGAIKSAVMGFTRSLAKSLAPDVRVNCVAPGWIRTAWGEQASDYWQDRAQRECLLQRWGTPEDVAAAVQYLASAGFLTGVTLPVNGGFRMRQD